MNPADFPSVRENFPLMNYINPSRFWTAAIAYGMHPSASKKRSAGDAGFYLID